MAKADVRIIAFLWNYNPLKNHDKIWGFMEAAGGLYSFWGPRGVDVNSLKSIKFKKNDSERELVQLCQSKAQKGYKPVDTAKDSEGDFPTIESVYPGFSKHVRDSLFWARLGATVRNEGINAPGSKQG